MLYAHVRKFNMMCTVENNLELNIVTGTILFTRADPDDLIGWLRPLDKWDLSISYCMAGSAAVELLLSVCSPVAACRAGELRPGRFRHAGDRPKPRLGRSQRRSARRAVDGFTFTRTG